MKTTSTSHTGMIGAIALGFFLLSSAASLAQDPIVAIGKVDSDGTVLSEAHTLGAGGDVTCIQNGAGDYTISLTGTGAFAGTTADDFLVEVSIQISSNNDDVAKANVLPVSDDQLDIDIHIDDVEDDSALSSGEPRSLAFFFSVYRVPSSFPATGSTRFLQAVGKVDSNGDLLSGAGISGISIESTRDATGDYEVTLTGAGVFAGADPDDFVIILNVQAVGLQDRGVRGEIVNADSNVVTMDVRVDELQDSADDNNPVSIDDQFFFTIYRVGPAAGLAQSRLLVAMGRVDGTGAGAGTLTSGGVFGDGMAVAQAFGTGDYRITINTAGRFAGQSPDRYVLQLALDYHGSSDDALHGIITLPDSNTMVIDVAANDVEAAGFEVGVAENEDFFFFVYDAQAELQPDLRIGRRRDLDQHIGNDITNASGVNQQIRVPLRNTRKRKFFLSMENDGNVSDHLRLRAKRSGNKIKTRYFRITGGRQNITADVIADGLLVSNVPPSKVIKYEAKAKYKNGAKRPRKKLRFLARSEILASAQDANRARLVPK